jgi:hypothetical protein
MVTRAFCHVLTNFKQVGSHPGRGLRQIFHELLPILRAEQLAQMCDMRGGDVSLAKRAQRRHDH